MARPSGSGENAKEAVNRVLARLTGYHLTRGVPGERPRAATGRLPMPRRQQGRKAELQPVWPLEGSTYDDW